MVLRRKDREINEKSEIVAILKEAMVCRIGLSDGNRPYIIPMNFGYKDNTIYLHSAREGKKIEILKKNNNVCFEVDVRTELKKAEIPCKWGMKYSSVIGFGTALFIEQQNEKAVALNIIMEKYSNQSSYKYSDAILNQVAVIKINITEMTGKKAE